MMVLGRGRGGVRGALRRRWVVWTAAMVAASVVGIAACGLIAQMPTVPDLAALGAERVACADLDMSSDDSDQTWCWAVTVSGDLEDFVPRIVDAVEEQLGAIPSDWLARCPEHRNPNGEGPVYTVGCTRTLADPSPGRNVYLVYVFSRYSSAELDVLGAGGSVTEYSAGIVIDVAECSDDSERECNRAFFPASSSVP